jgi:hypothetical protein
MAVRKRTWVSGGEERPAGSKSATRSHTARAARVFFGCLFLAVVAVGVLVTYPLWKPSAAVPATISADPPTPDFNEVLRSLTGPVAPAPSPDCRPVEGNVYNAFTVCDGVLRWSDKPTGPDLAPLADCRPAKANFWYSENGEYMVCTADVTPSDPPCATGYFGPSCQLVLRWPDRLEPAHERASPAEKALRELAPVEPSPLRP